MLKHSQGNANDAYPRLRPGNRHFVLVVSSVILDLALLVEPHRPPLSQLAGLNW